MVSKPVYMYNHVVSPVFADELHRALKTKDRQTDKPAVTDGNAICRNDNSWCHQRRQSRQNDDPLLSNPKEDLCDISEIIQA